MNTTIKPRNRILSLGLALCLLLGMTLYLPGPVEVRAANVELGTTADLTPDPDATGTKPGNQVYFGEYNGDPILWRVLENSGGEALLFSESILHTMPFKSGINQWVNSPIRAYLNTELLEKLPDVLQAQGVIVETDTTIENNITNDKLYLLSMDEVQDYSLTQNELSVSGLWWLRSPGSSDSAAVVVRSDGIVNSFGSGVVLAYVIRPAFRLNLSSAIFTSAGDGTDGSPWVVGQQWDSLYSKNLVNDEFIQIQIGNEDTRWKVIEVSDGKATLLCTDILEQRMAFNDKGNIWALSEARTFLNPENEWAYNADTFSFTVGERKAIKAVSVTEKDMTTTDTLFLLSESEVKEGEYFSGNNARKSSDRWWLRSPGNLSLDAAVVHSGGSVDSYGNNVNYFCGIRPAFRLNLSSVLFTSAAAGGKSVAVGDPLSSAAKPQSGAVKLTVKDDVNLGLNITGPDTINAPAGSLVTIPYTGAQTGPRRSVSVVIADSGSGEPLFYGRPGDCTSSGNGTASFDLPSAADLPQGSYKLLVFNEQVNGDKQTDYASTPRELTLTVGAPDTAKPAVTSVTPSGNGISIGTSSLSIVFDKVMDTGIPGTVSLDNGATATDGVWQTGNQTIIYDLSGLDYDTTYTVTIKDFADTSGNAMVSDSSHQFTTEADSQPAATLTLDPLDDDTAAEGENYSKTIAATHINGSLPLGYSASGLPDGLSVNSSTGEISGQPDTGTAASSPYTVHVTVSEQGGPLTASDSYTLTVTATPATATQLTLAAPTDLTVTEGEDFTKTFSVTYTGTGTLTYDIDGLPSGVTYSTTTGKITGPANEDGVFPIAVKVTDGAEQDTGSFTLTVLPASTPQPNRYTITATAGSGGGINPSGNVTVVEGGSQNFSITVDSGYHIADVLVNNTSVGTVSSYTFTDVRDNHTIAATFVKDGETAPDPDPGPDPGPGTDNSGNTGGSRSSRDRSSSGSSTTTQRPKTVLPTSAFTWEGCTLTIDHDSISVLGLLSVQWDNAPLTRGTDYGVYQGSVIVRFGEDFIAAQSSGDHTVKVEFLNHTGETTVTVGETGLTADEPNDDLFDNNTHNPNTGGYPDGSDPATDNPNTGDGRGIWFALLLGSIGAAALVKLRPRLEVK